MVCIYCGSKTKIVNSRPQKRSQSTWRRHHCPSCGATFTTQESVDWAASVVFVAKDGQEHPFIRETLLQSLYDSLKHRPKALTEAMYLTDTAITKLLPQINQAALPRDVVIQTCHQVLARFDKAAATTYLAYHSLGKS